MFFCAKNLVTLSVEPGEPWTFQPTETLTEQIRHDKPTRQAWYKLATTQHNFYTGIEAHAPGQRVSKENPPRFIHVFAADYDTQIPKERIKEVLLLMKIRPTYIEASLSGNFRLIWILEQPIPVENKEFCTFVLQKAHDWLRLDLLPGLDRKAFEETSRLYCNGCEWAKIGEPVPVAASQAFFVGCGSAFRFNPGDDTLVPLDLVEKALREKYPAFDWPGPFELETQGPSFWVPGSVSPQSAIVKAGGLFSFAMHAGKPFYSWTDLLGADFTTKFQEDSIAKATADVWWDQKKFWLKKVGHYVSLERLELDSYFRVTCRLSKKPGQNGISPIDAAFEHIYRQQSVVSAGPFVFVRPGLIVHEGQQKLNTWIGKPMDPAPAAQKWGPHGSFPMFSALMDQLFSTPQQLNHMLAWMKHFFLAAVNYEPMPGPNFIIMGIAGIGKTFVNREVIGPIVGGYADASDYLVEGAAFNSELFGVGHWCLDDDSPSGSLRSQARLQAMLKKTAANQQHMVKTKFEKSCMVGWAGRIGCTTNTDYVSSRMVGPLDNTSLDKTCLYQCNPKPTFEFPTRKETAKQIALELPCILRYVLDWVPPDYCVKDNRYGYKAYHEPCLLDQAHQSSPTATFKEILIEFLGQWFESNPEAPYWEGTVSTLTRSLLATNCNDILFRAMRMEQVSRYLEMIQREAYFKIEVHPGTRNVRLWRFFRDEPDRPVS
jgi:hypothetical protein